VSVAPKTGAAHALPTEERRGVYRAIHERRDVRSQFLPDQIPDQVLARLLDAPHHAPSVGFMQPWNFIVIHDRGVRAAVRDAFLQERVRAAALYEEPRRSQFLALKLEGMLDAPVNLCVTCDPTRGGPHVLGRSAVRETDVYSTCCAIQNFCLAARAEGIGVGWVSIVQPEELKRLLGIPRPVIAVAYLCMGYVTDFSDTPDLERAGWRARLSLADLVFEDGWGRPETRLRAAFAALGGATG
jgi:5,6-dimethylbenzimidazole synthase